MNRRQSARLDRKKFFADPVMLGAIFVLIVFLSLFILYPLAMLMIIVPPPVARSGSGRRFWPAPRAVIPRPPPAAGAAAA